ncbi:sulfite exporter TauE/SafE family protein [Desertivirga arenae]|uniref:sulfite exporter TauE/SafE family protein n=1 Tax=Desertivirga arenae TaxID=2810309 RepID=UPI001A973EAD|nr:sulfite exporter TauE/SafE family protein [Pedobacter sp. SYSU D00823]
MEILGCFASFAIGVLLGLLGGGGSILALPVMVYLFRVQPVLATSYSLFVVGFTSAVGSLAYLRERLVHLRITIFFGIPSVLTILFIRRVCLPRIPDKILVLAGLDLTKAFLTMLFFALLMIWAAVAILKDDTLNANYPAKSEMNAFTLPFYGVLVGLVTGLTGAGGGFLLLPALVLFFKLPMKAAVGTSLSIIAFNSLLGFIGDLDHITVNWKLLLSITGLAVCGVISGRALNRKVGADKLKKGFGLFVLVIGLLILILELSRSVNN